MVKVTIGLKLPQKHKKNFKLGIDHFGLKTKAIIPKIPKPNPLAKIPLRKPFNTNPPTKSL